MFFNRRPAPVTALIAAALVLCAGAVAPASVVTSAADALERLQSKLTGRTLGPPRDRPKTHAHRTLVAGSTVVLFDRRPGVPNQTTIWWLDAAGCGRPVVSALAEDGSVYEGRGVRANCMGPVVRGVRFTRAVAGLVVSDSWGRLRALPLPHRTGFFQATTGRTRVALRRIEPYRGEGDDTVFGDAEPDAPAVWSYLVTPTIRDARRLLDCLATGNVVCAAERFTLDEWGGPCEPCLYPEWRSRSEREALAGA